MDETTWQRRTAVPLMFASLAYLVAYSWRVIGDLEGPARTAANVVLIVAWAMFIVDYAVKLTLARERGLWFRTHIPTLIFAVIPVLRLIRLLRFLTRLPDMRPVGGRALRLQIAVYGVGASIILIYVASLATLEVERHAPGSTITTFGDAIWWACVTVTTTGYGDMVPVTEAGRWLAVGLMFGGVALAGIITATLASWVVDRAARGHEDEQAATRGQLKELDARLAEISARLGGTDDRT